VIAIELVDNALDTFNVGGQLPSANTSADMETAGVKYVFVCSRGERLPTIIKLISAGW
jgi:hypothetical protein